MVMEVAEIAKRWSQLERLRLIFCYQQSPKQRAKMPKMNISHSDRLIGHTARVGDCWVWQSHIDKHGYGHFKMDGRDWLAHRAAYWLLRKPFDLKLSVDHLCRNTRCVNPDHLEPVSIRENIKRVPQKEICIRGHRFTVENTYNYKGRRHCRSCNCLASKKYSEGRS